MYILQYIYDMYLKLSKVVELFSKISCLDISDNNGLFRSASTLLYGASIGNRFKYFSIESRLHSFWHGATLDNIAWVLLKTANNIFPISIGLKLYSTTVTTFNDLKRRIDLSMIDLTWRSILYWTIFCPFGCGRVILASMNR